MTCKTDVGSMLPLLGWQEWVVLPDLGASSLKAKLDTGAKTSALHAHPIEPIEEDGSPAVRFCISEDQEENKEEKWCVAPVLSQRWVRDSGGRRELRYVIKSRVQLGTDTWIVEIGLTNRSEASCRLLLGRTAIAGRYWVDPARRFLAGQGTKPNRKT